MSGQYEVSNGEVHSLPPGEGIINEPIVLRGLVGVTIQGDRFHESTLIPGPALEGKPVIQLVDCQCCTIRGLTILGNKNYPPDCLIESRVENPFQHNVTGLTIENLVLGKLATKDAGFDHGVRFTAAGEADGNNDLSTIRDCVIGGARQAGISIEHGNSLGHRIFGGRIQHCWYAVRCYGGAFAMVGTFLATKGYGCDFVFEEPKGSLRLPNGTLKDTARYYHPSTIAGVSSESTAAILWTANWPGDLPREDGRTGIHVYLNGYCKKGSPGPNGRVIDYHSNGQVSFTGCDLNFGRPTQVLSTVEIDYIGTRLSHPIRKVEPTPPEEPEPGGEGT